MSEHAYASAEHDRRISNLVRFGVIAEVDLAAGRARVTMDDDWTGDFLPWMEARAGAALRTWSPPSVGEQVIVLSTSGETGAGVILRGLYSDAHPAPANADTLTRAEWEDGARDDYDAAAHVRTLSVPSGGKLILLVQDGGSVTLEADKATVVLGSATVVLQDGLATIDATTIKFAGGAKAVARVGDAVTVGGQTGVITAGSGKVFAG